jgi:mannitol/fructose-specific phosphotransferase system IIA component (Ntr-type)
MNLKKVLTRNSVRIGLAGTSKNEIIEELVGMIVKNGSNLDREILLNAVLDRESQMSTGMKNSIAIPHGKTDAVSELHAVIAVSAEPVEFECLDKLPARIFVMTISPASHTGPHLQFLAEVSGLLTREDLREKILKAGSEDELLAIFLQGPA